MQTGRRFLVVKRKVVILPRISTDMQRAGSCDDQEREARLGAARKGIDTDSAIVLRDEAESGTKEARDGYQRVLEMMRAGEIAILIVDDQSRLSRGENVMAFIRDLIYSGARFISTSDGIDTDEPGWDMKVKFLEIHNSHAITGLKDKVLRGQRGRVLADGSAGDHPYGYESYYTDPDWQQQLTRRGPKPTEELRICDVQAHWIRKIFEWFLAGMSINEIARELTRLGAPKGNRATTLGWYPQQVHRILNNTKYIGKWPWRETTTIRNSTGKKKQIFCEDSVLRDRPALRIIDQGTWDLAQAKLAKLTDIYGLKEGQKKRGPKAPKNPAAVHPKTLLGGVLKCTKCGAAMWYHSSNGRRYYKCSNHLKSLCTAGFHVPAEAAEGAVLECLLGFVSDWPAWMSDVCRRLGEILVEGAARIPVERDRDERRLTDLKRQGGNIVNGIAGGGQMSSLLGERLTAIESEVTEIVERLAARVKFDLAKLELPDEVWVRARLQQWSLGLRENLSAAIAVREAVASLTAEAVVAPGKKRGYVRMWLRLDGWSLLQACAGAKLPEPLLSLIPLAAPEDAISPPIEIVLGSPTPMDKWAPDIVKWRAEGVHWEEIVRRTGLDLNRAFLAWKRYTEADQTA